MSMPIHRRPKPLRDSDRRPAPTEWIEYDIALVATGLDDALQQRLRLLSGVAETLFGLCLYGLDVLPYCVNGIAFHFVQVALLADETAR